MIEGGTNVHYETRSNLFLSGPAWLCLRFIRARRRTAANTATYVAVVAHYALARFLVDLSAPIFRCDDCDVYFHDERRRHGLHVA